MSDDEEWNEKDFLTFNDSEEEDENDENQEKDKDDDRDGRKDKGNKTEVDFLGLHSTPTTLPPWMDQPHSRRIHPLTRLHNEIVDFVELMKPRDEEMKKRERIVELIKGLAKDVFPGCKVELFGSQETGLVLPTSDIDIVIQLNEEKKDDDDDDADNGDEKRKKKKRKKEKKQKEKEEKNGKTKQKEKENDKNQKKPAENGDDEEEDDINDWQREKNPLHQIHEAILKKFDSNKKDLTYLEMIEITRVPIVKMTIQGFDVDICFNQTTGTQSAGLMKTFLRAMPPLRPLTYILKYFLASRGLNEPYSGGIGSFLLQLMIVSFLQHRERFAYNNSHNNSRYHRGHHPPRQTSTHFNLGVLLLEYLQLYGFDFNFITTGISVRHDGFYFPKGARDQKEFFYKVDRPYLLAMENPYEVNQNVAVSSFRIGVVQRSFQTALSVLMAHVTEPTIEVVLQQQGDQSSSSNSILASILPPTQEMRLRKQEQDTLVAETNQEEERGGASSSDDEDLFAPEEPQQEDDKENTATSAVPTKPTTTTITEDMDREEGEEVPSSDEDLFAPDNQQQEGKHDPQSTTSSDEDLFAPEIPARKRQRSA